MRDEIGTASAYPQYGYQLPAGAAMAPAPAARPVPGTNGLAIASLVVSIHGFGLPFVGLIGAILGHAARRRIAHSGESGGGLAVAGIAVGWVSTAMFGALVVLAVALGVLGY